LHSWAQGGSEQLVDDEVHETNPEQRSLPSVGHFSQVLPTTSEAAPTHEPHSSRPSQSQVSPRCRQETLAAASTSIGAAESVATERRIGITRGHGAVRSDAVAPLRRGAVRRRTHAHRTRSAPPSDNRGDSAPAASSQTAGSFRSCAGGTDGVRRLRRGGERAGMGWLNDNSAGVTAVSGRGGGI
jgi:hypothetical protein